MMIMRRGKKGTNEQLSDGDQKKSTGGQKRQKKMSVIVVLIVIPGRQVDKQTGERRVITGHKTEHKAIETEIETVLRSGDRKDRLKKKGGRKKTEKQSDRAMLEWSLLRV